MTAVDCVHSLEERTGGVGGERGRGIVEGSGNPAKSSFASKVTPVGFAASARAECALLS